MRHISAIATAREGDLNKVPFREMAGLLATALLALCVTHKHVGFREEREIRAMYIDRPTDPSLKLEMRVVSAGDSVKSVAVLPIGPTLNEMLTSVLIGPSPNGASRRLALSNVLADGGFSDVSVALSDIPYRP